MVVSFFRDCDMGLQSLIKKYDNPLFVVLILVLLSIFGYVISMPGDPPPVVAYVPPPPVVIEKQKVYRGTIFYKGESVEIEFRESMEAVQ